MFKFKTLDEIGEISGKKILLRLDLDVLIKNGKVYDTFRLKKGLESLFFLRNRGAKIIVLGHMGRDPSLTLRPVCDYFKQNLEISFVEDIFNYKAEEVIKSVGDGEVILFENLRKFEGERNNDIEFSQKLASFGDVFVNDAFANSHRDHASITGITKFLPSFAGIQFVEEVKNLSKVFHAPKPFAIALGGMKFETKLPLIDKFSKTADHVFIGGALAHDVFHDIGWEIGDSLYFKNSTDLGDVSKRTGILLPIDVRIRRGEEIIILSPDKLKKDDKIIDAGPDTIELLRKVFSKMKFILWNGPLGVYEQGYVDGTQELAKVIAESKAESVVGGGDTVAAINTLHLDGKFNFVSTAGGAMLDFLANETLPGIKALEQSSH